MDLLDHIKSLRAIPQNIGYDNGPEFVSKALDKWTYENQVILDFSIPGKPTDNAFAESFIGSLRGECLNVNWFLSLEIPVIRLKLGEWTIMSTDLTFFGLQNAQ